MKPTRDDDAIVDLVDTILRDGVVVQADVVVSVGDIPLVGISLRAAVAGMTTMTEYGHLTDFDDRLREGATAHHDDAARARTPAPDASIESAKEE